MYASAPFLPQVCKSWGLLLDHPQSRDNEKSIQFIFSPNSSPNINLPYDLRCIQSFKVL